MTVNSENYRGYLRFGEIAGITEQEIIDTFTGITSMNIVDSSEGQEYESYLMPSILPTPPEPPVLELTWNNISNVPVGDAGSVSDWNTFFDLPTNGSGFTSIVVNGNIVTLHGGNNITIKDNRFIGNTNIIKVIDTGCVIKIGITAFSNCTNLTDVSFLACLETVGLMSSSAYGSFSSCGALQNANFPVLTKAGAGTFSYCASLTSLNLPALTTTGIQCFYHCNLLTSLNFPALKTIADYTFYYCIHLITLSLPLCTNLGGTVGNNNVLNGISTLKTLTIPSALMYCNTGSTPDGDIAAALIANPTLNIIEV